MNNLNGFDNHHLEKAKKQDQILVLALPTETKVESGTSQSKSGTSVNLSISGFCAQSLDRGSRAGFKRSDRYSY